jgi:membrane protein implicated in regulation of membrane protease activity
VYDIPDPTHGFEKAALAFMIYAGLALCVGAGAVWLGASYQIGLIAFCIAAIVLLSVFVPIFRRLIPDRVNHD